MARFEKQDRHWLPLIAKWGDINPVEETLLLTTFDQQTNFDIKVIEEQIRKEKQAKRVCLYKMIMYPFEYILIKLLFGTKGLEDKTTAHKIHKAYYKNKISYIEYTKRLANFFKDARMVTQ